MRYHEITEAVGDTPYQHYMRCYDSCLKAIEQGNQKMLKFYAYQAWNYWFNVPEEEKQSPEFKQAEKEMKQIYKQVNDLPRHGAKARPAISHAFSDQVAENASCGATSAGAIAVSPVASKKKKVIRR